jgi:Xaa-Pro aminopeptidase
MIRRHLRVAPTLLLLCAAAHAADTWKVAGAPPASAQRDLLADLRAHRRAAIEGMGAQGISIFYAAEPRNYAGDVDWPYRQENNFYYLTGIPQEGSTLVLTRNGDVHHEILFVPPSAPAQEAWTGHILTHDEMRAISGIEEIYDSRQLNAFLRMLLPQAEALLADKPAPTGGRAQRLAPPDPLPSNLAERFADLRKLAGQGELQINMLTRGAAEHDRESEFAAKLGALTPPLKVTDATAFFQQLRKVKSPREIDLLQHAVDITEEAFQRVMAVAAPGVPEYEAQAQFEFTFLRRGGHWGYPCIVASGSNATTLHYETNRDTMKPGELLLIDDAAEFDGYSADITRTIPVSGKFSKEQAEIYRLVWEAQQAGMKMAKPGHRISGATREKIDPQSVGGAAIEVFKQGLYKLGLITDPNSAQQVMIWFNHGIGHGIGLNVHDPAGPELSPGMVITVEPGLYIRPNALDTLEKTPENLKFIEAVQPAFEKYKGIGVRLEDDLLITTGEPKLLSSGIPSKLEDVEATVARLRKAVKSTPMP